MPLTSRLLQRGAHVQPLKAKDSSVDEEEAYLPDDAVEFAHKIAKRSPQLQPMQAAAASLVIGGAVVCGSACAVASGRGQRRHMSMCGCCCWLAIGCGCPLRCSGAPMRAGPSEGARGRGNMRW